MEITAMPPGERSGETMFIIAVLQYRGAFHQQATQIGGIFGEIIVNCSRKTTSILSREEE